MARRSRQSVRYWHNVSSESRRRQWRWHVVAAEAGNITCNESECVEDHEKQPEWQRAPACSAWRTRAATHLGQASRVRRAPFPRDEAREPLTAQRAKLRQHELQQHLRSCWAHWGKMHHQHSLESGSKPASKQALGSSRAGGLRKRQRQRQPSSNHCSIPSK